MNGILIVNKPKEFTSHDVCAKIKKIAKVKVGHTGTLDPMATGVLPLLLGEGTKLSEYLTNHDKVYEAVLKLGIQTDTADSQGKIVQKQTVDIQKITKEQVQKVFKSLVGKQKQTPPMYSAIKVKGKKLYEYAREGKKVEIPEREIEIYALELIKIQEQNQTIAFRVHCSKGTYIRTLCEAIAKNLDTIGYMEELNRVQVGEFTLKNAVTLQEIEENKENEHFFEKHTITIAKFFEKLPSIKLQDREIPLLLNGVQLTKKMPDGIYQIKDKQELWIGIGTIQSELLKRKWIVKS